MYPGKKLENHVQSQTLPMDLSRNSKFLLWKIIGSWSCLAIPCTLHFLRQIVYFQRHWQELPNVFLFILPATFYIPLNSKNHKLKRNVRGKCNFSDSVILKKSSVRMGINHGQYCFR
uniref:Uncharacterized protein n=1 Tax=Schistocephalus solidus TaxID=70667 RepID=A0A0X3Q959_SCHSO